MRQLELRRKIMCVTLTLISLTLTLTTSCVVRRPAPAPTFSLLRVESNRVVDVQGETVSLKGCNLGNWFLLEMWMLDLKNLGRNQDISDQYTFESILRERFGEKGAQELMMLYRENWIAPRDFALIRSFGFNAVRLPFHYSLLEDDARPLQLKPDAFRWLDYAVSLAKENKLYVILDLHGAPGGQSVDHRTGRAGQNRLWDVEKNQRRVVWLWREIATHYRNEPAIAAYDLLNEPFGDYRTETHRDTVLRLMDSVYRAIREVDSRHIIIFPGTREGIRFYGNPAAHGWTNVMFTEHHYPGVMQGSPSLESHKEHIRTTLAWLKHYLSENGVPLLVGEFNVVFRRAGGPRLMRYYYDLFERNGWWGMMWSYKLIHRAGGVGRDNWYLVTNQEPAPEVNLRESSYDEIARFFAWFGRVPYAVDEELRTSLTAPNPFQWVLEDPPLLLEAPAHDDWEGWQAADIAAQPAGGQRVYSDGRVDEFGGGRDIWNKRDEFRFLWKNVEGEACLEATVLDMYAAHRYSKAGVMFRDTRDPDAPHVLLHVFPDGQVAVGWREARGKRMREKKFPVRSFPIKLKLVWHKGEVSAYYRDLEDDSWREAGKYSCTWGKRDLCAGLAVLSHDARFLTRASFDQVRLIRDGNSP